MAVRTAKKSTAAANKSAEDLEDKLTGIRVKEIDGNTMVPVRNGFYGVLVYRSNRTGETYIWQNFGDEQDISLNELKACRASNKAFFTNNWFMFDDDWVVDYLGMRPYYKYAVRVDDFDKVLAKSASEIEEIIGTMSEGQKKSLAYRARELVADGTIDSNRVISTLERCLCTELIERG